MTTERRLTIGVRARILATVLLLAALGMAFAGSAFTVFERRQLIDHLDSVLLADVGQFHQEVGQLPGQTMSELLPTVMGRHVPVDGEVVGGFLDGQLAFVTADPPFRLLDEPENSQNAQHHKAVCHLRRNHQSLV